MPHSQRAAFFAAVRAIAARTAEHAVRNPHSFINFEGVDEQGVKALVRSVVRPATDRYEEFVWRGRFN
jgi:hypothetical protein